MSAYDVKFEGGYRIRVGAENEKEARRLGVTAYRLAEQQHIRDAIGKAVLDIVQLCKDDLENQEVAIIACQRVDTPQPKGER